MFKKGIARHFNYRHGNLYVEKVSLEKIANQVGTPVYVYSKQALLDSLKALDQSLRSVDHQICFAVKANSNLKVLGVLNQAGAGMDIVSGGELLCSLKAGGDPQKIIFSGVGKTELEMRAALKAGIFAFNVESEEELAVLNKVSTRAGVVAVVSFRFNPDVNPKTHPHISTGLKKNKFGLERKEILSLAGRLKEFSHIRFQGVSVHIGSQILKISPFEEAFKKVQDLVLELERLLSRPLSFVDLGGGIGVCYKNELELPLTAYCGLIEKLFGSQSRTPLKVILEPGRFIAAQAGVLVTRVLYRKPRGRKDFVIVDAGMNDFIRPALYGSYHEIIPLNENLLRGPFKNTDVVGPICESSDTLGPNRKLSQKIKQRDLLAILSAGAYGFSMASQYNARPLPQEVFVDGARF